jgi:F0F1-type ATP synthase epsilon subunit
MNIRFQNKLRQLFRLINRLSLIEKFLFSFLLVFVIQAFVRWIYQLYKNLTNWIDKTLKNITDYIYLHSQTITLTFVIIGILVFGMGCFFCFRQWKSKQSQLEEDLDDEDLDEKYLLQETAVNPSQTIYTEGNYNENVYGGIVEIYGDQININNDFAEVAEQIRDLVEQLKSQGYTQEEAEEEIAKKLEEKALENPKLRKTLRRWRKYFSKKNNPASDKEVAQDVVRTATSYSYTESKDFTDVIGGDFHILNELLQSKKWKEADWETAKIIYAIAQNELPSYHGYKNNPPDCIVGEHVKVIPRKYLKNIDNLWKKHSNGRFGFSVQKRLFKTICKENSSSYSPYLYNYNGTYDKFGDLVGWRKEQNWLYYADLHDSLKTAAPGHLPATYMLRSDEIEKCEFDFDILMVICERL